MSPDHCQVIIQIMIAREKKFDDDINAMITFPFDKCGAECEAGVKTYSSSYIYLAAKIYSNCQGVIMVQPHVGTFGDEC